MSSLDTAVVEEEQVRSPPKIAAEGEPDAHAQAELAKAASNSNGSGVAEPVQGSSSSTSWTAELEKEKAAAALEGGEEMIRLSPPRIASERDHARAQVGLAKESVGGGTEAEQAFTTNKGGGEEKGEPNDEIDVDEVLALPTSLSRQTVRHLRPSQPGAVAVTGMNARHAASETVPPAPPLQAGTENTSLPPPLRGITLGVSALDSITDATVPTEASEAGGSNNNEESATAEPPAVETTREERRSSSTLPVATVVEAELVDDLEHDDVREKLNEKEQEVKELNDKLKEMESLKREVENLRKKVTNVVPASRVSITEAPPPPPPPSFERTKTDNLRTKQQQPRMSTRERYARQLLLGDHPSLEFDAPSLPPTDLRRHTSDSQVHLTTSSDNMRGGASLPSRPSSFTQPGKLTRSSSGPGPANTTATTTSKTTTTTNQDTAAPPTTEAVAESACCVIL